jgi:hypothetical protein
MNHTAIYSDRKFYVRENQFDEERNCKEGRKKGRQKKGASQKEEVS